MTEKELTAYKGTLSTTYGIPEYAVTSAVTLTVDVTIAGSQETKLYEGETLIVMEINGVYYTDKALGYAHQMAENASLIENEE